MTGGWESKVATG